MCKYLLLLGSRLFVRWQEEKKTHKTEWCETWRYTKQTQIRNVQCAMRTAQQVTSLVRCEWYINRRRYLFWWNVSPRHPDSNASLLHGRTLTRVQLFYALFGLKWSQCGHHTLFSLGIFIHQIGIEQYEELEEKKPTLEHNVQHSLPLRRAANNDPSTIC